MGNVKSCQGCRAMKHDEFFRKHPVFTGKELAKHLSSRGQVGSRAQEALLAYHRRTGRVVMVRRGVYAVIPAGADPESYPVDPFLVAAKLTADAVLSYHTALEFHGRAYSIQEFFTYSASRPPSPVTFRSHVLRIPEQIASPFRLKSPPCSDPNRHPL